VEVGFGREGRLTLLGRKYEMLDIWRWKRKLVEEGKLDSFPALDSLGAGGRCLSRGRNWLLPKSVLRAELNHLSIIPYS
jgi:hypothetical protein